MTADFHIDTRAFAQAVAFVERESGKDGAEILNKAGLSVIIGGRGFRGLIQLTPRADAGQIRGMPIPVLVAAVIRRRGDGLSRAELRNAVKAERARRLRSRGYTAGPGWHKAALAFGGRGVRTQPGFSRSDAAKGSGKKARPANLVAEIVNTAPAASRIGSAALSQALSGVTADLTAYGNRKMQERFNKL